MAPGRVVAATGFVKPRSGSVQCPRHRPQRGFLRRGAPPLAPPGRLPDGARGADQRCSSNAGSRRPRIGGRESWETQPPAVCNGIGKDPAKRGRAGTPPAWGQQGRLPQATTRADGAGPTARVTPRLCPWLDDGSAWRLSGRVSSDELDSRRTIAGADHTGDPGRQPARRQQVASALGGLLGQHRDHANPHIEGRLNVWLGHRP